MLKHALCYALVGFSFFLFFSIHDAFVLRFDSQIAEEAESIEFLSGRVKSRELSLFIRRYGVYPDEVIYEYNRVTGNQQKISSLLSGFMSIKKDAI